MRSKVWLVLHPVIITKYICEHGASYPRTPPALSPFNERADDRKTNLRAQLRCMRGGYEYAEM